MIHQLINKRIDQHINDHKGLYTKANIKTLRPIWYKQIEDQLNETLKAKNIIT